MKKELNLQDKVPESKLIKEALDKKECEEFEMALQHKSKLHVYKELKNEVGFEEYLQHQGRKEFSNIGGAQFIN